MRRGAAWFVTADRYRGTECIRVGGAAGRCRAQHTDLLRRSVIARSCERCSMYDGIIVRRIRRFLTSDGVRKPRPRSRRGDSQRARANMRYYEEWEQWRSHEPVIASQR